MKNNNYKIKNKILVMLTTVAVMMLTTFQLAWAEGTNYQMPDTTQSSGTLTIEMTYSDSTSSNSTVVTLIDGATFRIYRVADLTVKGGDARYTLTEPFAASGIKLDDSMTASSQQQAAQQLAQMVVDSDGGIGHNGTGTTGKDGKLEFTNLPLGMYLVVQTGRTGTAANYTMIDPYLVDVPKSIVVGRDVEAGTNDKNGNPVKNNWEYVVPSVPKTSVIPETPNDPPPEETPPPPNDTPPTVENPPNPNDGPPTTTTTNKRTVINTGDITRIGIWIGMVIIACIVVAVMKRRQRRDETDE